MFLNLHVNRKDSRFESKAEGIAIHYTDLSRYWLMPQDMLFGRNHVTQDFSMWFNDLCDCLFLTLSNDFQRMYGLLSNSLISTGKQTHEFLSNFSERLVLSFNQLSI